MALNKIELIIYLITSILGAGSTYYLQSKSLVSKVQASAITTLIFSLAIYTIKKIVNPSFDSTHLMVIFWGASFAGMSSSKIVNWITILIASILFLAFLELSTSIYTTHGGKLGLLAAIASITSIAIVSIIIKAINYLK